MKLTKKTTKKEVETTETVCEITQAEFDRLCAKVAASAVMKFIGDDPDASDLEAGLSMTAFLADFVLKLDNVLFKDHDTNETHDEKEEK